MKVKQNVSSQLLIPALAALGTVLIIQAAQAQDTNSNTIARNDQTQNQALSSGQYLKVKMPQKSLGSRILENTTLTYYQQFLGPTLSGPSSETYNVFQEGINQPGTGRAPLQSFHAANIRYNINRDWAIGASLAAVNGYTGEVANKSTKPGFGPVVNRPDDEFFNARAYVVTPAIRFTPMTFYTTIAYEAPTSVTSRNDDMTAGAVLIENISFNLPNPRWNVGILGQYYRAFFNQKKNVKPPQGPGFPTELQTVIVSGGPYANYRFNDNWQLGSMLTFDWDQRGPQTGSSEYNNNLPHRGRMSLTYFPTQMKVLSNVGVFAQTLLKFRPKTTALGADFTLRF